eukprot:m.480591 g.480591  ORF g.480591 m.480591 type:complete len:219 (+) comp21897_c0_seq1:163-819(+)
MATRKTTSPDKKKKEGPPKAGAFKARATKPTQFRFFYERGDFPIALGQSARGNVITWKAPIDQLDYHHYLPLFFDGLCEKTHPYSFFAREGVKDMLEAGGEKITPVVPQLIIPVKNALNTRDAEIVGVTLKLLQQLATSHPDVGAALVPYYRQILPIFNLLKNKNLNSGDQIDYGQKAGRNIGDLVHTTLNVFERTGGPDAFINIKYMVPTYESCMMR